MTTTKFIITIEHSDNIDKTQLETILDEQTSIFSGAYGDLPDDCSVDSVLVEPQ